VRVRVRVRLGSTLEITPGIDAETTPETAPEIGAPESESGDGGDVLESGEGDDAPETVVSWRSGDNFARVVGGGNVGQGQS
tara:strand:- start:1470 stop:1712 length:243 start_codon:yes stop_codon:yes gene_type:complete